jgi:hypothetical protein
MEQLSLTSFQKGEDRSILDSFTPHNNILLQWACNFPDFNEESQIETIWDIEILLKEAVITRKKKPCKGFQLLLLVRITDKTHNKEIENFIYADETFEQQDRFTAIKEYSNWCAIVWFHWKIIGESRARVLPVLGDTAYMCPCCGFASESDFECCNGCGRRFWKPDMWRGGGGDEK